MEGNGGVTTVTKAEASDPAFSSSTNRLSAVELDSSKTQTISGKYNSVVIVKYVVMDIASFNRYNPDFDKQIAVNGNFQLRLPADKMELFNEKK